MNSLLIHTVELLTLCLILLMAYRVYLHYKLLESSGSAINSDCDRSSWQESEPKQLNQISDESTSQSLANEQAITCTQKDSDKHAQRTNAIAKPGSDNPLKDYIGDFF